MTADGHPVCMGAGYDLAYPAIDCRAVGYGLCCSYERTQAVASKMVTSETTFSNHGLRYFQNPTGIYISTIQASMTRGGEPVLDLIACQAEPCGEGQLNGVRSLQQKSRAYPPRSLPSFTTEPVQKKIHLGFVAHSNCRRIVQTDRFRKDPNT